jgi:hypothetical protein
MAIRLRNVYRIMYFRNYVARKGIVLIMISYGGLRNRMVEFEKKQKLLESNTLKRVTRDRYLKDWSGIQEEQRRC